MQSVQVAPPFESVPPTGYGGTERVVATLTDELVRRGHQVTLIASGDSRTSARLVPTIETALWRQPTRYHDSLPFLALTLGRVAELIDQVDIIHSHLDVIGLPLTRLAACPVVTTLHGRLDLPELEPLYRDYCDAPLVSISASQRRPLAHLGLSWAATPPWHRSDAVHLSPRAGSVPGLSGSHRPGEGRRRCDRHRPGDRLAAEDRRPPAAARAPLLTVSDGERL